MPKVTQQVTGLRLTAALPPSDTSALDLFWGALCPPGTCCLLSWVRPTMHFLLGQQLRKQCPQQSLPPATRTTHTKRSPLEAGWKEHPRKDRIVRQSKSHSQSASALAAFLTPVAGVSVVASWTWGGRVPALWSEEPAPTALPVRPLRIWVHFFHGREFVHSVSFCDHLLCTSTRLESYT